MVQEGEMALSGDSAAEAYSLASESLNPESPDTLKQESPAVYALVYNAPLPPEAAPLRTGGNEGVSFILCGLFALFLIIALRFRNNIKYAVSMFRSLVETRTRQNIFDDTVRETSLIVLLNIMWCACTGIIIYSVYRYYMPGEIILEHRSIGMLWGMALALVYALFMWWMYAVVGWIFSDRMHSALWVKGYAASQALMTPAFFLTALMGICQPETAPGVGIVSAVIFILVKLVFIWKGYRIFFNQFSSWVLFLCYLCSLEIVPLIMCYRCAVYFG